MSVDRVRLTIDALSHDSLLGRRTPSNGLDAAAEWVAAQFAEIGLSPGGDRGGYIQRYAITTSETDNVESAIWTHDGQVLRFGRDVQAIGPVGFGRREAEAILVTGVSDMVGALLRHDWVGKHVVVFSPPLEAWCSMDRFNTISRHALHRVARLASLIIVVDCAPSEWSREQPELSKFVWREAQDDATILRLRMSALGDALGAGFGVEEPTGGCGVSCDRLKVHELGPWVVDVVESRIQEDFAPNVVGVLPGRGRGRLVLSAHLDHIGYSSEDEALDSVYNGADDNASGVAALLEMAQAAIRVSPAERGDLVFLASSGEEEGFWGSEHFISSLPPDIPGLLANLNLDMVGRNAVDSIAVVGTSFSELGNDVSQTMAQHDEVGLHLMETSRFYTYFNRSDNYSFASVGVPSVSFFSGLHEDYHEPSDEAIRVDVDKVARVARLAFFVAMRVSVRSRRPSWLGVASREFSQRIGRW